MVSSQLIASVSTLSSDVPSDFVNGQLSCSVRPTRLDDWLGSSLLLLCRTWCFFPYQWLWLLKVLILPTHRGMPGWVSL